MKSRCWLIPLALFLAAGCATPEARIRENPEAFAELNEDVQAKVRQGQIEVGYSSEAVHIALGDPDRKYARTTDAGTSEVWSYVGKEYYDEQQRVHATFRIRDSEGRSRRVRDSVWADVRHAREYERVRVELRDGRVVAIESIQR